MGKTKTTPFDVAEHFRTRKDMALYLEAMVEAFGGDAAAIAHALGDIACAQDVSKVARDTGLSREPSTEPVER